MEHFKKLVKMSMKMLNEAEDYASKYYECKLHDDSVMSDLYYNMAHLHLDGYNKVKAVLASELNKMKREDPKTITPDLYMMIKDVEADLYESIQEKLRK